MNRRSLVAFFAMTALPCGTSSALAEQLTLDCDILESSHPAFQLVDQIVIDVEKRRVEFREAATMGTTYERNWIFTNRTRGSSRRNCGCRWDSCVWRERRSTPCDQIWHRRSAYLRRRSWAGSLVLSMALPEVTIERLHVRRGRSETLDGRLFLARGIDASRAVTRRGSAHAFHARRRQSAVTRRQLEHHDAIAHPGYRGCV